MKDIKRQTFKAISVYLIFALLIIASNIVCVYIALTSYYGTHQWLCLILCVLVGILAFVLAIVLINHYLLLDTLSVAYYYLTPFFKKLTNVVTDKIEDKTLCLTANEKITTVIDIGLVLSDTYSQKVPSIIQKGIMLLLSQIPFPQFIEDITEDVRYSKEEKKILFGDLLYNQVDRYIQDQIFGNNSLKWLYWVIPLNILIQIILVILIN